MILLNKAKQAADALEIARVESAEREDELLQMLVENANPADASTVSAGAVVGAAGEQQETPRLRASVVRR